MSFETFKAAQQAHLASMTEGQSHLFAVDLDKDRLWDTYLDSFPPGTNEIFRERREHDCSCCRHFIKSFGHVVAIKDNELVTAWDFECSDQTYIPVAKAMSAMIKAAVVDNVFVTKQSAHGTDKSLEQLDSGQVHTWHHFRVDLPKSLVYSGSKTEAAVMGEYRDTKNVFKRSLEELSPEAVETVLDLIAEKTLYRGEEWLPALTKFKDLQSIYHALPPSQQDNYAWARAVEIGGSIAKIRNHSIGTLLQDLTDGMDIDQALRRWEAVMAPSNYKRPKAVFTKRMVEQAEQAVDSMGLLPSLGRRHAIASDVSINNVIWANRSVAKVMDGHGGVFDLLRSDAQDIVNPLDFNGLPAVHIDNFVIDVLPGVKTVEVLLENSHAPNMVSLISPQVKDAPPLFKWSNGFSWAYGGNVTDATMRERVKAAGGSVTGVLRFSIQWNTAGDNPNDFDAHCIEPNGNEIYFANRYGHRSLGELDVDIIYPKGPAVENITWPRLDKMQVGEYKLFVRNYSHRGGRSGFEAEIEFGGVTYEYEYHQDFRRDARVARIVFDGRNIKFLESLPSTTTSKEMWGLTTNQFHPVSMLTYSPNYWDGQRGIGNKHHFFMLQGCKNEESPNGFFNEYLREDLMPHKRVFEALGSKMRVQSTDNQLSGLGFSSTRRSSLIIKADGRPIKLVF